jgi:ribosomal protein S18 acetylase RimI-like enzyme
MTTEPHAEGTTAALRGSGRPVAIAQPPGIDGLVFRRWRDEADLAGYVAVVNASWAADGMPLRTGPENEATDLRHRDGFELETDLVLAELDSGLIGFASASVEREDDGGRRHWTSVMLAPAGRRPGLLEALYDWAEEHHRAIAATDPRPDHGLWAWVADDERWWAGFLAGRGYRSVRWFSEMVRDTLVDLPDKPLPPGLEVRPVPAAGIRRVLEARDEAFRDHWGHTPMTQADVRAVIDHPRTDPSLWVVAWDGDEVAGLVVVDILHDENAAFGLRRGWLRSVATRRPWRNRGLASALCVLAMRGLRDRGYTSVGLGVDTENPTGAYGLYERLGFRVDLRASIMHRPLQR